MGENMINWDSLEFEVGELAENVFQTANSKGFWDMGVANRNQAEMIALMHQELSEALDGIRKPQQSDKIPEFTLLEEEFADLFIRMLDFVEAYGVRLIPATKAKMEYNLTRPYKHGKKF